MKKSRLLLGLLQGTLFLLTFCFYTYEAGAALTAGETYTITLSKVNSNGSVTDQDSTAATANDNGKISFVFSNVPTSPATHFLVLTISDQSDEVVRKSFVPAPPEGGNGQLGANDLSTVQTNMILSALEGAGTDDPIVAAYGLILTRTPDMTDDEVAGVATLGRLCIMQGFESMLLANGVSAAQLTTFKDKLVYNQPNKDLSNFTALFKSAVDNPDQAADDMSLAAGLIADIFIDAGVAAGIDLSLILAGHDAAGVVFETDEEVQTAKAAFGASLVSVINQSMTNFGMRISAVKLKASYADAFSVLNSGGDQVTRCNSAIQSMVSAMQDLDKQYGQYYEDPSLMAGTPGIQDEINAAYQTVFTAFQAAIAASNEEVAAMKTTVATALGIAEVDLPPDLGTYDIWTGGSSETVNWPIPQVVATNWVANILLAGGTMGYDNSDVVDALPVPDNMTWLNGTGERGDFSGMPPSFAALVQMQEDMEIAEMTRNYIDDPDNPDTGGDPTGQERQDAKIAYADHVALIAGSLTGTTDGTTAISTAQKEALAQMMEHPNF